VTETSSCYVTLTTLRTGAPGAPLRAGARPAGPLPPHLRPPEPRRR